MLASQSPNAFHRARTLTKIIDQSSFCSSQTESNQLTFEGLRNQLRFVPTMAQKNSTIGHVKAPSLSKITPQTTSSSKSATLKSITKAPSGSGSPIRQRSSILSRKNTLDMQIGQLSPIRQHQLSSSKELISPRDIRRESPSLSRSPTPKIKPNSLSSLKVSSIVKKQSLVKQGSFGLPFNKVVMTLPDQEYPDFSRLDTKMSTNENSGALSSRRVKFIDEDDKVANKIANDGIISFKEILKKHCRYRSHHLVEPIEKCEATRNFSPKVKSIIQKKPLQSVQNIDVNPMNADYMSFLTKGSLSVPNAALMKPPLGRIPTLDDRRLSEEEQSKQKAKKLNPILNEKKMKESEERLRLTDSDNLMKMIELSEALKPERPLTLFEKEFLNLIKEGGDLSKIRELIIKNKELVNISDNRRQTPLHWAIKKDRIDVVEVLCDYGVEINTHDMALRTPMDIAKRLGNNKVVKCLKDYASQ